MKIEIENDGNTFEIRKPLNYEKLKNQICKNFNLMLENFENMYKVYYQDDTNDLINVSNDVDYDEAINLFETQDIPKKFIINMDIHSSNSTNKITNSSNVLINSDFSNKKKLEKKFKDNDNNIINENINTHELQ